MRKKRMGRPPLPKEERREHRVTLGVNAEEFARISELADGEGVTPSVWARDAVLRALKRRKAK